MARVASGVVRRSLRRAGVVFDTLTSLFRKTACEAVPACLISDTTDDRVARQQATPQQCTATQTAALHQHHTTPSSCSGRNRPQASDSGWPWGITQNGSISSLTFLLSLISSFFTIFPSSFCCFSPLPAFPQFPSHLIPSFAAPPPDSATAPGPPVSSSGPLPQTAHDPLCCLRIHRVSLALFAVGRL
jgi:hypothetical protein